MFQHTAARRRLLFKKSIASSLHILFQHTAARRRLHNNAKFSGLNSCFNTQPPEGGCATYKSSSHADHSVSTHSRPKAAACGSQQRLGVWSGFNTQPPEGGCHRDFPSSDCGSCFNTQPPEGGCAITNDKGFFVERVSTHSRPKAAAILR